MANSYDAPMLAAVKKVFAANNIKITVLDSNLDPKKQDQQLQTATSSKQYDGIIVQPVFGGALINDVKKAIKAGIKVVNVDQILGAKYNTSKSQVPGLSGNFAFVPRDIGTKMAQLIVAACKAKSLNPCKLGYLYSVKAAALDVAIKQGIDAVLKQNPQVQIVAEGESFYQPATALKAVQTMVQAQPDMNALLAADQGIEGAATALPNPSKMALVGYGAGVAGLKQIASGAWYGSVAQAPATEGKLAAQCMAKVLKGGKPCGGYDAVAALPDGGKVTKANVSKFKGEWPG